MIIFTLVFIAINAVNCHKQDLSQYITECINKELQSRKDANHGQKFEISEKEHNAIEGKCIDKYQEVKWVCE